MHDSFLYMIAYMGNRLPAITKSSTTLAQFRAHHLINVKFTGCHLYWTYYVDVTDNGEDHHNYVTVPIEVN